MKYFSITLIASSVLTSLLLPGLVLASGGEPHGVIPPEEIERTLTEMWWLAIAAAAHQIFEGEYPSAGNLDEFIEIVGPTRFKSGEPTFVDAWGNKILVSSTEDEIEIRSLGSDGHQDEAVTGGMSKSLSADIVIQSKGEEAFVQYPEEFCDSCPPQYCGVPPNTISIDACNVDLIPAGRWPSFVETVVYRVTTNSSGMVIGSSIQAAPKVLDQFLNLDQFECCIERWVLLPDTEYLVSLRAGTTGQAGSQWEIRVCHPSEPCIQVNLPRVEYDCNEIESGSGEGVPAVSDQIPNLEQLSLSIELPRKRISRDETIRIRHKLTNTGQESVAFCRMNTWSAKIDGKQVTGRVSTPPACEQAVELTPGGSTEWTGSATANWLCFLESARASLRESGIVPVCGSEASFEVEVDLCGLSSGAVGPCLSFRSIPSNQATIVLLGPDA